MSNLFPRGYCTYCLKGLDECICDTTMGITTMNTIVTTSGVLDKDVVDNTFKWDDNKVIEFVSWYLELHGLDVTRYCIENSTIIESFKKGDEVSKWKNKT